MMSSSDSSQSLSSDLAELRMNGLKSDFVIECHGEKLPVHKAIILARSAVFKAMFSHDFVEESQSFVTINNFSLDVVNQLITFMYTEKLDEDFTQFRELMMLADQYRVNDLVTHCAMKILEIEPINLENALEIGVLGDRCNCDILMIPAAEFLAEYLLPDEDWKEKIRKSPKLMTAIIEIQRNKLIQIGTVRLELHETKRFGSVNDRVDLSGYTHGVEFVLDRKVWLHGIGLYGAVGEIFNVQVKVFVKENLKIETRRSFTANSNDLKPVEVVLPSLVEIEPNTRNIVLAKWTGNSPTYRGAHPKTEVYAKSGVRDGGDALKINFFPLSQFAKQNGATHDQIPSLFFITK